LVFDYWPELRPAAGNGTRRALNAQRKDEVSSFDPAQEYETGHDPAGRDRAATQKLDTPYWKLHQKPGRFHFGNFVSAIPSSIVVFCLTVPVLAGSILGNP
jgi:hypothetical protein